MLLYASVKSRKNVVVLIPPAIEPGEPPISIKISERTVECAEKLFWLTVSKPAVLSVTD